MKRIVIVGATSCIAEHCARLWVEREPAELTLVGRDEERLSRLADDLEVRSPESLICIELIDSHQHADIARTVQRIYDYGPVDLVLIATGTLIDQQKCELELAACHYSLTVNAIYPVLFAEAIAQRMQTGTLAIIGSVAGDRGRKSNYVYGAAKGLVARYAQGLQHRFARSPVSVVLIKPGPTDTPMTAKLKAAGARLASVDGVARAIVRGIDQGKPVVYVPGKWKAIMWVIRHLPAAIFNKLDI